MSGNGKAGREAEGTPGPEAAPVRVLLTGFEPFGGEQVNPSWSAVRAVADAPPDGVAATAVLLPVEFDGAGAVLREAVAAADPALVLCVGQAGGRADVTVERVAVNLADSRSPDNAGRRPEEEPVVPGGPAAYFAALPVRACVAAARGAGVPASASLSAGTFVCNRVFYTLAHLIATERPGLRGGFVHVPYEPAQAVAREGGPVPTMPVEAMADGLRAILAAALEG